MDRILFCGFDEALLTGVKEKFLLTEASQIDEVITAGLLQQSVVFLIGSATADPIRLVQKIYAADKHLSILLFAAPGDLPAVKQSLQYAAYVGKNTLCVSFQPHLDFLPICESAAQRTRQKRSFLKITQANPTGAQLVKKGSLRPEHLGAFMEQAPVAVVLLNEEDEIIYFNQQAKKIFGYRITNTNAQLQHLFGKKCSRQH